jgi:hypothetical protein
MTCPCATGERDRRVSLPGDGFALRLGAGRGLGLRRISKETRPTLRLPKIPSEQVKRRVGRVAGESLAPNARYGAPVIPATPLDEARIQEFQRWAGRTHFWCELLAQIVHALTQYGELQGRMFSTVENFLSQPCLGQDESAGAHHLHVVVVFSRHPRTAAPPRLPLSMPSVPAAVLENHQRPNEAVLTPRTPPGASMVGLDR